jgi:hypothetical protein
VRPADPQNRLDHYGDHDGLYTVEQTRNGGYLRVSYGKVTQQEEHEDGRDHEEGPCDDAPQSSVQPPTDVGRYLLSLGSGQKHAEVQRPQELPLRNPTLPLDQLLVHDRDLARRTAEVDEP